MKRLVAILVLSFILAINFAFAASITVTWTNAWLSNSSVANTIDDQMNALSTAIQERSQNGGRYWPSSNDAKSGINVVSSSNYVTGEWSVYESDLTTKAMTLTDTTATIGSATTLSSTLAVTGASTFTGAVTANNNLTVNGTFSTGTKRYITITNDGAANTNNPNLDQEGFTMPQILSTGTIKEWGLIFPDGTTGSSSIQLRLYTPTWSTDKHLLSCKSGTVIATLTPGTTFYGARTTTFSTSTISAGDELCFTRTGTVSNYATSTITIELPW